MNKLSLLVVTMLFTSVVSVRAYWDDTTKKTSAAEKVVKETGEKYDTAKGDLNQIKAVEKAEKRLERAKKSVVKAEAKLAEAKEIGEEKDVEKAEKRLEDAKKSVIKAKANLKEKQMLEEAL